MYTSGVIQREAHTAGRVADGMLCRNAVAVASSAASASLCDAAEQYTRLGWRIVPCWLSLDSNGKKTPAFGLSWQAPVTFAERLRALGGRANGLALLTGEVSGVTVVDVDAGDYLVGFLPPGCVSSISQSGGRHYFFRYTRALSTSCHKAQGFDVRNDGGLIVLPPSVVQGGGAYRWQVSPSRAEVATAPGCLVRRIHAARTSEAPTRTARPLHVRARYRSVEELSTKQRAYLERYAAACASAPVGQRSEFDMALVGWGVRCGLTADALWGFAQGLSKFRTAGRPYFNRTYQRASMAQ